MDEKERDAILDTLEEFLNDNNSAAFSEYLLALKDLRDEYDSYRSGHFIHINQWDAIQKRLKTEKEKEDVLEKEKDVN